MLSEKQINKKGKTKKTKHSEKYDEVVPNAIFDIEDSDETAEAYMDMFGYC